MKTKIIELLSESSDFLSGEKISDLCGISRTAVWKNINTLKEEGYEIITQARKGYKLIKRPDALLKTEIIPQLQTEKWGKVHSAFLKEVDSTNTYAKKLAFEGKPEGTIVVSEHQTLGKGRLGRVWNSVAGKGIWVSFILRPQILPSNASQITFVIAVGMVKALQKALDLNPKIKWPNDILVDRKKVVGILTELSAEIDRVNHIIVGIGVNCNQNKSDFPLEFREKATSLKEIKGEEIIRAKVLRIMLEEIEKVYNNYLKKGFADILQEWKDNSITIGQEVEVMMGKERLTGKAVDVDESGCLLVKDSNNTLHSIIAGDVSIRNSEGSYA